MPAFSVNSPHESTREDNGWASLGGWLFRQRTWLPLPLAATILFLPPSPAAGSEVMWIGGFIAAGGELLRFWSVRHIGVISRTRSDRLGPLVDRGPFGLIRNPLYIGNIALWAGFALSARLIWLTTVIVAILAVEYHAIVRWEEQLLESRLGEAYRVYAARVPRWIPTFAGFGSTRVYETGRFSWGQTLFSERGTLIAIAVGYLLVYLKRNW